jgi:hypothetical protein
LPNNGIVNWLPCIFIPKNCRFALVGNTNSGNILRFNIRIGDKVSHYTVLCKKDFHWIMFYPTLMRINLCKFLLLYRYNILLVIKKNSSRTCSPLIQREDVFAHLLVG